MVLYSTVCLLSSQYMGMQPHPVHTIKDKIYMLIGVVLVLTLNGPVTPSTHPHYELLHLSILHIIL